MFPTLRPIAALMAIACLQACDQSPQSTAPTQPDPFAPAQMASLPQGDAPCLIEGDKCIIGMDGWVAAPSEPSQPTAARSAGAFETKTMSWPFSRVTYRFASTVTTDQRTLIRNQMAVWTQATGVTFSETSSATAVALTISVALSNGSLGGMAHVGYNSTVAMTMDLYDLSPGNILHELGHVLGLSHEQERLDRDDYLTFNSANVLNEPSCNAYYPSVYNRKWLAGDGPFDVASVMLYPSLGCAKNSTSPVITLKNGTWINQATTPSAGDIASVKKLYQSATWSSLEFNVTHAAAWSQTSTTFSPSFLMQLSVVGEMNGRVGTDIAIYDPNLPGFHYLAGAPRGAYDHLKVFTKRLVQLDYPQHPYVEPLVGDFTGDGIQDLLATGPYGSWSMLPGAVPGPTMPAAISDRSGRLSTGLPSYQFPGVAIEVNGDQYVDFVRCSNSSISIWVSTGTGFKIPVTVSLPTSTNSYLNLYAGDFDGDKKMEVARLTPEGLWIHKITPSGTGFVVTSSAAPARPAYYQGRAEFSNLVVGDYDKDGKDDILWADFGASTLTPPQTGVSLLRGVGGATPSFDAPKDYALVGVERNTVFMFTNTKLADGTLSTLVTTAKTISTLETIKGGLLGKTTARYNTLVRLGDNTNFLAGDFNGDGFTDLASILPTRVTFSYGTTK